MKKNIVLVGLMGAGKTTIGKAIAQRLGCDFFDTDEVIEKQQKMSVSDIFAEFGESKFRELEKDTILSLSEKNAKIISIGGGSLENLDNLKNLQKNGFLVYLKATPEVLYSRIIEQTNRPLLQVDEPVLKLKELLAKRESAYLLADFVIETENKIKDEIIDEILKVYDEAC